MIDFILIFVQTFQMTTDQQSLCAGSQLVSDETTRVVRSFGGRRVIPAGRRVLGVARTAVVVCRAVRVAVVVASVTEEMLVWYRSRGDVLTSSSSGIH